AEYLFGNETALIKIDMSEFMEKFSVSRLIGSPPGYVGYDEGGQLTEQVRRRPYAVILFDEIEKAHPDVFNILLQILDDGRLTDGQGRAVDFRNTILIMTSNVGASQVAAKPFGFRAGASERPDFEEIRTHLQGEVKRLFRPEFLNRVDETIVFRPLELEDIQQIVDLLIRQVGRELRSQGISLQLTERARQLLAERGYDPAYGARPLRRTIQKLVENPLSEKILEGQFTFGDLVIVDLENEELVFHTMEVVSTAQ
ncbi:MAG: AAA family ATPase, partial [bacterium]